MSIKTLKIPAKLDDYNKAKFWKYQKDIKNHRIDLVKLGRHLDVAYNKFINYNFKFNNIGYYSLKSIVYNLKQIMT